MADSDPLPSNLSKYPHIFAPPGFIQFDRNGIFLMPATGGVPYSQVLETINITSNYEGWVRTIGFEAGDWSVINLQIQLGGIPIRDYTKINVPLGSPTTPKEVFIRLPPNLPLTLVAFSDGTVAESVRWNLWGWYYSTNQGS